MIRIKRAYEQASPGDGTRFLVDRLWPRGIKKAELQMDAWLKDVGTSQELHRWYDRDPAKWDEYRRRYEAELDGKPDVWRPILEAARKGTVTLLYGARDSERNNAVVLKEFLDKKLS